MKCAHPCIPASQNSTHFIAHPQMRPSQSAKAVDKGGSGIFFKKRGGPTYSGQNLLKKGGGGADPLDPYISSSHLTSIQKYSNFIWIFISNLHCQQIVRSRLSSSVHTSPRMVGDMDLVLWSAVWDNLTNMVVHSIFISDCYFKTRTL